MSEDIDITGGMFSDLYGKEIRVDRKFRIPADGMITQLSTSDGKEEKIHRFGGK